MNQWKGYYGWSAGGNWSKGYESQGEPKSKGWSSGDLKKDKKKEKRWSKRFKNEESEDSEFENGETWHVDEEGWRYFMCKAGNGEDDLPLKVYELAYHKHVEFVQQLEKGWLDQADEDPESQAAK